MNKVTAPKNINECLVYCIHQDDAIELIDHALLTNRKLVSKIKEGTCNEDQYFFQIVKGDDNIKPEMYIKDYVMEREGYGEWTAVLECAKYGKYKCFKRFVEMGFSFLKTDNKWNTPYDVAIHNEHYNCAQLILHNHMFPFNERNEILYHVVDGAYPDANAILRKALYLRKVITFDEVDKKIKYSESKDTYVKYLYQPDWQNKKANNQTALHVAASKLDYFKIAILIEHGFTTQNALDDKGKTPFDQFCEEGDLEWLKLWKKICYEAAIENKVVEKYMHNKLLIAKDNCNIDDLTTILNEGVKSKLNEFSETYSKDLIEVIKFRNTNYKMQMEMTKDLIKIKKNAMKSRRYDLLVDKISSCNEYIISHNNCVGIKLQKTFDSINQQLLKWQNLVNSMIEKLNIAFKTKDIISLEKVLNEARNIVVISNDFYNILVERTKLKCQWEKEINNVLLDAGVPAVYISRYLKRICSNIEELHKIRWLDIKGKIGIQNKETCKIICRNLHSRQGYANVDDSQNEMKQFLKDCNLINHLEILTYSGFLDVEDLADEDDLAIFDDIMSEDELNCLEIQLARFRKKYLRN